MAHPRQPTGHSSGRRGTDPWDDPYDPDNDYGSHQAASTRDALRRADPPWIVIGAGDRPCSLCEPGYVCQFHREP